MRKFDLSDGAFALGLGLVLYGVSLWSWPSALILSGSVFIALAIVPSVRKGRR